MNNTVTTKETKETKERKAVKVAKNNTLTAEELQDLKNELVYCFSSIEELAGFLKDYAINPKASFNYILEKLGTIEKKAKRFKEITKDRIKNKNIYY